MARSSVGTFPEGKFGFHGIDGLFSSETCVEYFIKNTEIPIKAR